MLRTLALALAAAAVLLDPPAASAADLLTLTVGQRGNWDTSISHLGEKAGIFKKHGLELEIVYPSGSGETLQPVVAGSVDLGLAVGTLGAISAFAKSAPVRIVGAEARAVAAFIATSCQSRLIAQMGVAAALDDRCQRGLRAAQRRFHCLALGDVG